MTETRGNERSFTTGMCGFAVGVVFTMLLALLGLGMSPAHAGKSREALCDRALATATASDSLSLAQKPYRCNMVGE